MFMQKNDRKAVWSWQMCSPKPGPLDRSFPQVTRRRDQRFDLNEQRYVGRRENAAFQLPFLKHGGGSIVCFAASGT